MSAVPDDSRLDLRRLLAAAESAAPIDVIDVLERELAAHVLRETGGELRDDATVLCLDWYRAELRRHAVAGASRTRATGGRRPSCGTSHEPA